MKKIRIWGLVFVLVLGLMGCGSSPVIQTDTLSLSEDGTATYTIISDFSKPHYDLEELKQMAQEELNTYGSGIQISLTEVTDGVLTFQYTFDSLTHYAAFMETICYSNTVSGALSQGYKADTKLVSSKGKSVLMKDDSISNRNLFIWNEQVNVRCDGNVLYFSENLTLIDKTDVQPKEGSTGPYYVVYK